MALGRPIKGTNPLMCEDFAAYGPLMPGVIHVAPPCCYRCEYGLTYPGCDLKCATQVEAVVLQEEPETVAAFLATPVSAQSLCDVPPPEYWPIIRSICNKYGIVMQMDCVVTGFGRTGKMFAVDHFGIVPDIMSVAKGIISGYMPLSATIMTGKIADKFEPQNTFLPIYLRRPPVRGNSVNIDILREAGRKLGGGGQMPPDKLQALSGHPTVETSAASVFCSVGSSRTKAKSVR
jgi:4-aminobutyrate aminotransferase-like enzyme